MAEQIKWAGRTLSGADRFGHWATTGLEGWWDSPDTKGESADRPSADGEYDLPIFNQARLVTVTGHFRADSHAQMHEAANFLTGPMSGRFQVSGHGSVVWADAKRNGGVKFTPITDVFAQWQVRLKCPDPRKFGDVRRVSLSSPGDALLFHYGNYDASPVVTVTGNFPSGYTIWGPSGKTYVVTAALLTGQTHRIDFTDGLVQTNGYYWTGRAGDADVWTIPPGQSVQMGFSAPSGSGTAVIEVLDTFI